FLLRKCRAREAVVPASRIESDMGCYCRVGRVIVVVYRLPLGGPACFFLPLQEGLDLGPLGHDVGAQSLSGNIRINQRNDAATDPRVTFQDGFDLTQLDTTARQLDL